MVICARFRAGQQGASLLHNRHSWERTGQFLCDMGTAAFVRGDKWHCSCRHRTMPQKPMEVIIFTGSRRQRMVPRGPVRCAAHATSHTNALAR